MVTNSGISIAAFDLRSSIGAVRARRMAGNHDQEGMSMARYGRDFSSGRQNRPRNPGDTGLGYDQDFGSSLDRGGGWSSRGMLGRGGMESGSRGRSGGQIPGGWSSGRGQGRNDQESGNSWGGIRSPRGQGSFESPRWGTGQRQGQGPGQGQGREDPSRPQWGQQAYGGREGRGFYDRDVKDFGASHRSTGEHYDVDFGDRLRRGWNRVREGVRDRLGGSGYDRDW